MTIKDTDDMYVAGTYGRFPVEIVSGKGSIAVGSDGKEYIDMGSGIGVTSFGLCDDAWKDAVVAQVSKVQHMSNLYYTEPCGKLAEMLCSKTGMKKVFFSNSGAEANECAIKVARKYAAEKKGPEFNVILTLNNSFHGRTLTTLSATGQDHYHELFQPLTPGFVSIDPTLEAFEDAIAKHKVAGILIEVVQGEGGVVVIDGDFVKGVAKLCKEEDIVFMVDEVQTGNGRTGKMYAYMNHGVEPDVVTTAKGLGGGLPIGATLLGDKVKDVLGHGDHGSTFGGNPVSCAAAISVVSRLDDAFLAEVSAKAEHAVKRLQGAPGVKSVSGMGLMIGIETERPASEVIGKCVENGVLCLSAKTKVRLLPALNIPMDVLDRAIDVILDACKP